MFWKDSTFPGETVSVNWFSGAHAAGCWRSSLSALSPVAYSCRFLSHSHISWFALTSRDCADLSENIICFSAIIFCRAKSPPLWFLSWKGCCCERLAFTWQWFQHGSLSDRTRSNADTVVRRVLARFTSEEPENLSVEIKGLCHLYKCLKKITWKLWFFLLFLKQRKRVMKVWGQSFPSHKKGATLSLTKRLQILLFLIEGNWRPVSSQRHQVGSNVFTVLERNNEMIRIIKISWEVSV